MAGPRAEVADTAEKEDKPTSTLQEAVASKPSDQCAEGEEKSGPHRVAVKSRSGGSSPPGGRSGGPKKDVTAQLAMAFDSVPWEESNQEEALVGEGVGDFARGSDSVGGSAPKGKRGGRRSADSDGRRRRSNDSEGRRRKSWDTDSRTSRRRSGEGRRSGDSRKSMDNSRRSGESRKSSQGEFGLLVANLVLVLGLGEGHHWCVCVESAHVAFCKGEIPMC